MDIAQLEKKKLEELRQLGLLAVLHVRPDERVQILMLRPVLHCIAYQPV